LLFSLFQLLAFTAVLDLCHSLRFVHVHPSYFYGDRVSATFASLFQAQIYFCSQLIVTKDNLKTLVLNFSSWQSQPACLANT
jgi:hypothetical protein